MALLRMLPDVTWKSVFKDGGVKPEVPIFQLLDKIATPFQRLTPIFGVKHHKGTIWYTARCNWK